MSRAAVDSLISGRPTRAGSRVPRRHGALSARAPSRVLLPLLLLNAVIAAVMLVGPVLHWTAGTAWPAGDALRIALAAGAVWGLSFMPGWLFVRFLDRRAGALWDEYVVHLHRLGVDEHGNLPEPPRSSSYHREWVDGGGEALRSERNLYREKFDAYYGKNVSRFAADGDQPVRSEALFPVFLTTGLLAAGWTAILYDPAATLVPQDEPTLAIALTFGFLGGYLFFLQMLMRRYFQTDLRAGSYVSGYVRIVSGLIVVAALFATFPDTPVAVLVAVAFGVGWFPSVGLQWLLRTLSRRLRGAVPSVEPAYPLNRLDGLNVWYEARLLEEGIEDLENLVTAKVVDVLLHTRVPVGRLVDWVDQALLLIHLPAEPAAVDQAGRLPGRRARVAAMLTEMHPRQALRRCGIRSASSLLRALEPHRPSRQALIIHLQAHGIEPAALLSLRDVVAGDRRIRTIWNWQAGEAHGPEEAPVKPLV